jgi:hypothetical protein
VRDFVSAVSASIGALASWTVAQAIAASMSRSRTGAVADQPASGYQVAFEGDWWL